MKLVLIGFALMIVTIAVLIIVSIVTGPKNEPIFGEPTKPDIEPVIHDGVKTPESLNKDLEI